MTIKQIREKSLGYVQDMYPTVYDFRIEQFEENANITWNVVVSFLVKNLNTVEQKGIMAMTTPTNLPYERIFKTLVLSGGGDLKKVLMYKG